MIDTDWFFVPIPGRELKIGARVHRAQLVIRVFDADADGARLAASDPIANVELAALDPIHEALGKVIENLKEQALMLYRVSVTVDMMVVADDPREAESLARENVQEDLSSGAGDMHVMPITDPAQVPRAWAECLPWGQGDDAETCQVLAERAAAEAAVEKEKRTRKMAVVRLQVPLFPKRRRSG